MLQYKNTSYSWTELNTNNNKIDLWGRDLLGMQFKYLFSFFLGLSAPIPSSGDWFRRAGRRAGGKRQPVRCSRKTQDKFTEVDFFGKSFSQCFWLFPLRDFGNKNFSPDLILPIQTRMHICPCSRTVGISKKIWIQNYFGPVTVDSEEVFRHFAFWRDGSRLATFSIAPKNCIFCGVSFEPIKNLATLDPEKLQGFHWTPIYHFYTLVCMCVRIWKFHVCRPMITSSI